MKENRRERRPRNTDRRNTRAARYQLPADAVIEYKNVPLLQKFITERGKLVSRRISGISAKKQRSLGVAVKRARYLGLLPVGSVKRK